MFDIAQANAGLNTNGTFTDARVPARTRGHFALEDSLETIAGRIERFHNRRIAGSTGAAAAAA